jgi:hypothetical protein
MPGAHEADGGSHDPGAARRVTGVSSSQHYRRNCRTVTDSSAAVVPGAAVLLKDEGTGIQKNAVTDGSGAFAFRDLSFGLYEVTVKLQGFQTVVYKSVVVESGRTTDLRVKLGVVSLETAVTVEGVTPVLEITSNAISSTRTTRHQQRRHGRDAFTVRASVQARSRPRRGTHFNGMPAARSTHDRRRQQLVERVGNGGEFFDTVRQARRDQEMTVESPVSRRPGVTA